jgi:hypothetical protein
MRRRRRRDTAVFSLSMLDCICCGFGAVILLFVLSKFAEPVLLEQAAEDLSGLVAELEERLFEIRGESAVLDRELRGVREQLADAKAQFTRLRGDLSAIQGEFAASAQEAQVQTRIEAQMAAALQELTDEMRRLLGYQPRRPNDTIGGIPVDSEYIIFIIDTSGSMRRYAWGLVLRKMRETLEIYPNVEGIQVMNDLGVYMYSQYRGRWIPDSPARRQSILSMLARWSPISNSSPVEGIEAAIRQFYDPNKKISLYIFGDDFSGSRAQPIVDTVERLNAADASGTRRVRIHAVGFPVIVDQQPSGIRFATLMRELCRRNGGTFVGLNGLQP